MQFDSHFSDFLKCTTFLQTTNEKVFVGMLEGRERERRGERGSGENFRDGKRTERSDVLNFTRSVLDEFLFFLDYKCAS